MLDTVHTSAVGHAVDGDDDTPVSHPRHDAIHTAVGLGETCAVCHRPGGIADPAPKHPR